MKRRRNGRRRKTLAAIEPSTRLRDAMSGEQRWSQAEARGECPSPDKIPYLTRKMAKQALKEAQPKAPQKLHAYRCRCGRFHLGTASLKPGPAPELG